MRFFLIFWRLFINRRCVGCQKIHANEHFFHICKKCTKNISTINEDGTRCPICFDSWFEGDLCQNCLDLDHNWQELTIIFPYQNPLIKEIFSQYKFHNSLLAEKDLTKLLKPHTKTLKSAQIIIAPCSKETRRRLGFNPVARILDNLEIEYSDILVKDKSAPSQKHLSGEERKSRSNPFSIREKDLIKPNNKTIFVVDDIFTTGTTISHMIRTIKESGINNVNAFCFARD
ncbi:MAG: ComF family protein [Brevinema sp.]